MSKFGLLGDLSESRLFPTRKSFETHNAEELAELAYLYLVGLRILLAEKSSQSWAETYCQKTTRSTSYHQWRTDGNDLYMMLHALLTKDEKFEDDNDADYYRDHIGMYARAISQWLATASRHPSEDSTKRFFLRLDSIFRIKNASMRAIRRLVQDWPTISAHDRRLAMTRLLQFLRARARKGDLLPQIDRLSRDHGLELHDVCNPETGSGCDDERSATHHTGSFLRTLLPLAIGAAAGYAIVRNHHRTNEMASAGATSAASVATVVGSLGAGFDDDHSKSIYTTKKPMPLIRRHGDRK